MRYFIYSIATFSLIALLGLSTTLNAQNVGIGTASFTPLNRLDVKGNAVIGNNYSGVNTAPTNGLLVEGNVGIGTVLPTERLDVTGSIKFSASLMPNNLPGNAGQVLRSAGAGAAPVWGAQMAGIGAIELWYLGPQNFNAATTYTFTVTGVTGCTESSIISLALTGSWSTQPNVTIHHIEARTGEFKFRISNNTLTTNYIGMDFNVLVIR